MKRFFTFLFLVMLSLNAYSQASGNVDLGSQITNGVTTGGCVSSCNPTYCSPNGSGNHPTETMTINITGIPASNSVEIVFTSVLCASTSGLDGGDDIFINGTKVFDGSGNAAVNLTSCVAGGADILIEFTANRRDEVINVTWNSGMTDPGAGCFMATAPVELTSFNAENLSDQILLNWTTSAEINNDYFIVQYSIDGKSFKDLEKVNGNGSTTIEQNYRYIHNTPANGTNFYRLQQVDYDGSTDYSDIVSVRTGSSDDFTIEVYPTAFNDVVTIISSTQLMDASAEVYDIQGSLVSRSIIKGNEIDLSTLHNGTYVLRILSENNVSTHRIIKL